MVEVPNIIVDNIFTEDEIKLIYDHVENTPEDRRQYQNVFAQTAYLSWLPEEIVNKINSVVSKNFDTPLVLKELSFARYENSRGLNPLLFPHYDDSFKQQRVTFDIQLKSSMSWSIVIEDVPYTLEDNQALFFSGTNQIHWREKVIFGKDDFVDMIFCHFSEVDPEDLSEDHLANMEHLKKKYQDEYYN